MDSLTMPTSWARFQRFAVDKSAGVVLQESSRVLGLEVEVESGKWKWKYKCRTLEEKFVRLEEG